MLFLLLGFMDDREALYEPIDPREDFFRLEIGWADTFRLFVDIADYGYKML